MANKSIRITEDRMIRIQVLDRCFSDRHRTYYIEDLVAACNQMLRDNGRKEVQKRAVWNDIFAMEGNSNWQVDLIDRPDNMINGRRFFRYRDPNYSIFRNELNEEQVSQLKSMLLMLHQFRGLPQFAHLENMVRELENKYRFTLPETENIISFDTNEYVDGLEHLSPIFSAIVGKRTLRITYKPFGKDAREAIVSPYFIKQYNGRWFLICKADGFDNMTNYAFDRITRVEDVDGDYRPADVDFEEYFDDIVGVTFPKTEVEPVILRFSEHRFPYVQSKPLHPSQHNHKEDCTIEIKVHINKELVQRLLSYGSDVTVLGPETLKQKMKEEIQKMADNY